MKIDASKNRAILLCSSPYKEERDTYINLFSNHDYVDVILASDIDSCLQSIQKADLLILSWDLGETDSLYSITRMWSGRRNGPVFVTTKIAKTLDECHEMLGDLYEVGVLMYFFRLSDAAILKIITHEAKGVLAVKQLRKKNFPLSILKDRKLSTIAVFAIFLAILYTAGIITGPDLILWLKIIFGG